MSFLAANAMLPFLMVNLAFALVALAIGFLAGAWFLGGRRSATATTEPENTADSRVEKQLAMERAMMASTRLRELATGVASDVGEHNTKMERISSGLAALQKADDATRSDAISEAMESILTANQQLQQRLERAESQIQAQAEEIRLHESEARTDALTTLSNRRAFDDEMTRRFAEWRRKQTPFSLILLDVDHFKKFNDSHGHQAGDEVLRAVARCLKAGIREMDLACRYGGEEFAIVLPATHAKDLAGMIERMRKSVQNMQVKFEQKTLQVTASFGLAQVTGSEEPGDLLRRADEALYASKNAGRNCAHLHDGERQVLLSPAGSPPPPSVEQPTTALDALPNRTKFAEDLRRRIAESQRTAGQIGIIAVEADIDSLAAAHGAGFGQTAMDCVAQFLQSSLREMDTLARLHDNQFIAMLPGASLESTQAIASRAIKALSGCKIPLGAKSISLRTQSCVFEVGADDTAASTIGRAERELRQSLAAVR